MNNDVCFKSIKKSDQQNRSLYQVRYFLFLNIGKYELIIFHLRILKMSCQLFKNPVI